jgi:hypothetical protein
VGRFRRLRPAQEREDRWLCCPSGRPQISVFCCLWRVSRTITVVVLPSSPSTPLVRTPACTFLNTSLKSQLISTFMYVSTNSKMFASFYACMSNFCL